MRVIYKYTGLEVNKEIQTLMLPIGFTIRDIHCQRGHITVWAEVDSTNVTKPIRFRIFGTGWPIENNEGFEFLQTVHDGMFVWHIFAEI